jgi:hypothetical protein
MRKLTVDEIIQGLVDAYERLLKLESIVSMIDPNLPNDDSYIDYQYAEVKGEVKALRWVLGQDEYNIITEEDKNE